MKCSQIKNCIASFRNLVGTKQELSIPNHFIERGYREIIQDEDFSHEGETELIEELDK